MLIGLAGYKGSGKDTVGAYLVEKHDFTRLAFAHKLKQSVDGLMNTSIEQQDSWKNDPDVKVVIVRDVDGQYPTILKSQTFREFLQRYGTEAHRDIFGDDFWVNAILPEVFRHENKKLVVTDVRFQNEADRIVELGGIIAVVERPIASHAHDLHASEQLPLGKFYHIRNYKGFDELYHEVEELLNYI